MSRNIPGNNKHLTLSDRIYIEKCLDEDSTFKDIAKYLCKDPSSITREVKSRLIYTNSMNHTAVNYCANKSICREVNICNCPACGNKRCSKCNRCNKNCKKFKPNDCYKRMHRAPYVCNGCPNRFGCHQPKRYYRATNAEHEYKEKLHNCREGINLTPEELTRLDNLISPLVLKGQPIFHIYTNNKGEIGCSVKTIYNYINAGILSAKRMDLRRAVKYKKRYKAKNNENNIPKNARIGRTLEDMDAFLKEYPELRNQTVQMDTVMGCKGSKQSLLTMYFTNCNMQLSFILDEHTAMNVGDVFDYLELKLGIEAFKMMFPLIVTDNGTEFSNPEYLETAADGSKRTKIFFCDPYSSWQKGECEKNHEYIRYVIPKGQSMDDYIQADINKLMCHINSLSRESLHGYSPYDLALIHFGEDILDTLNITKIPANDICLNKSLLK